MDEEKSIALAVSWKLSNLLVQESSVSLFGLEDQLECIESKLRETVHSGRMIHLKKSLREIVYDIEEIIDVLVIKASQKVESGILMCCIHDFLDLFDQYKLSKKLDQISTDLSPAGKVYFCRESWWSLSRKDFDIGDTIISPVIRKVTALVSDTHLSPAVKRQARWFRDELTYLHDFLKVLEVNGLSEGGEAWMEEVYDVLRFAEDVVVSFLYEREKLTSTWIGPLKNFLSQRKVHKEMDLVKAKIQDIYTRRPQAVQRRPRRIPADIFRTPNPSSSSSAEKAADIAIFDDDIDDIVEMLLKDDPNCLTISIVGMEGTGKTTLAKLIYENHAVVDHFPHRAWVPSARMDSLMRQIAWEEYLNMSSANHDGNDFLDRSKKILNAVLKSNKYLIVIDNVSTKEFWNQLGPAFEDLSNGTRIIFTARRVGLTRQVIERDFIYRLQLRSDDESWVLFNHYLNVNIPLELLKLKREILRRCGGLPKMIKDVADILLEKDATSEEWSRVLERLNQNEGPWSGTLYEINKNLPLYLRRCLFYFVLFPEHYEIPARRLIGLWVAEGLGRQKGDKESPECVSDKCLIELVNENMIQVTKKKLNGKINRCRMPDALQIHWLSKAKEANFLQDNIGLDFPTKTGIIRRLADHLDHKDTYFNHIHGNNKNSSSYSCYKDVVSFLSFDTREGSRAGEDIGNFLAKCITASSFHLLWVLDLENVYKPKLPKEVGHLTRLRYLGLRSTYLEALPVFIDKLLNLRTLDLKRTCIGSLPSSIWKMKSLTICS